MRIGHEHFFAVVEGVHDNGACIAEPDLEDRVPVLTPPFFADGGMVVAQFKEMACYGERSRDFGEVPDVRYVGAGCELRGVSQVSEPDLNYIDTL